MSLPEAPSQSLAVLSLLAVRIRAPSGLNTASLTSSSWAKEAIGLPEAASQSLKLWDAASGKLIAFFDHQGSVKNAAFSPDGTQILTASADHSARLWDTASGKLMASF